MAVPRILWKNFLKVVQTGGFTQVVLEERTHDIGGGKSITATHLIAANRFRKLILHAFYTKEGGLEVFAGGKIFGVVEYAETEQLRKIFHSLPGKRKLPYGNYIFFFIELDVNFWDKLEAIASIATFVKWPQGTPHPNLLSPEYVNDANVVAKAWQDFLRKAPPWVKNFTGNR